MENQLKTKIYKKNKNELKTDLKKFQISPIWGPI